ncbi:MAG: NUDIX domain-containing protein [Alphaproteobacteria bacterium]|nr:NUDIX domain-containing protein [Alphaproteobacteria bacterium]
MFYKQCAAVYMLLERGEKYFFLKRRNTGYMDGFYGLPAGKIDKNEDALTAALRELKEETGLSVDKENLKLCHVMHRQESPENPTDTWIDMFFRITSWTGEPENKEKHKAEEGIWLDYRANREKIVPAVYHVLEQIENETLISAYGWRKSASGT